MDSNLLKQCTAELPARLHGIRSEEEEDEYRGSCVLWLRKWSGPLLTMASNHLALVDSIGQLHKGMLPDEPWDPAAAGDGLSRVLTKMKDDLENRGVTALPIYKS